MDAFTWRATFPGEESHQPRLLESKFGEGYVQSVADGINTDPDSWDVSFDNLPAFKAQEIMDFLAAKGGHTPFLWAPAGDQQFKYRCKVWKRTINGVDDVTVRATFERFFG